MLRFNRTSDPDLIGAKALVALKRYLRLTGDWADPDVLDIGDKAIEYIQARTRKQFLTASYQFEFDSFPDSGCITLPISPLAGVTRIDYTNSTDVVTEWQDTEWEALTLSEPGHVRLKHEKSLPSGARDWVVQYTAGYGAGWTDLPPDARQCIELVTHHFYHNRDGSPPMQAIENMITQLTVGDEFVEYAK